MDRRAGLRRGRGDRSGGPRRLSTPVHRSGAGYNQPTIFRRLGAALGRSYFHLHLVSDSTGETLIAASRAASAQYQGVASIEHVYPLVRTPAQLDRVIAEIENAPGIVLFTLVDSDLSKRLEEGCDASGSPCLSVLGPILTLFKSYLGQNSTPRAGAQHMLNADYFKRIDALNFSMMSDDGQAPENLEHADIVLLGVSRTSKTPTSIYLANRGYKTANVPLVPHVPLPRTLDHLRRPLIVGLIASADRIVQIRQNRLLSLNADSRDRICRSHRGRRGDRGVAPAVRGTWLADDRRDATVDRRDGGGDPRSLSRASAEVHRRRLMTMHEARISASRSAPSPSLWRAAQPLVLASKSRATRIPPPGRSLTREYDACATVPALNSVMSRGATSSCPKGGPVIKNRDKVKLTV